MAGQNKILRLAPIDLGLNTTIDNESRPPNQCGDMKNWTMTRQGAIATRQGHQRISQHLEGASDHAGLGLASYSYFDSDNSQTVEELLLLSIDNPKRLKAETLTITGASEVTVAPFAHPNDTSSENVEYGIQIRNGSNQDILSLFDGTYSIDISASHWHGSVLNVADDLPWSVHFELSSVTLPGGGSSAHITGNQFTAGNYELIQLTSDGDIKVSDNNATTVTWSLGLTSSGGKITIVCDGTDSDNLELFLNGESQGTKTLVDSEITVRKIGDKGDGSLQYEGTLKNFYFYNTNLDSDDITNLNAGTRAAPANLVNYTPFYYYGLGDGINTVKTVGNIVTVFTNHPTPSASATDSTIPGAHIPMVISSEDLTVDYYSLETINTAYHAI